MLAVANVAIEGGHRTARHGNHHTTAWRQRRSGIPQQQFRVVHVFEDFGTQRVVYVPYNDTLHVIGMNQSTTTHREFMHVWDPEIHVGRILT